MLRIVQQKSAAVAKGYYRAETSAGYYAEGGESHGHWGGEAAARLGLVAGGVVDWEAYERLCENRHPTSGEPLTVVTVTGRRVLYDVSWSAPKSVSLLFEWTQDPDILDAFRAAVNDAMQAFEQEIRTRVRKDGADFDRVTANGVWATFVHRLSRPVDGVPDPQLHAHCALLNATYDAQESRWKALTIAEAKSQGRFFEAVFHVLLASNLRRLGYSIEKKLHGRWEIAGLTPELLRKFSRRTVEIEALAREQGIVDPEQKDRLGATTRQHKRDRPWGKEELRALWTERMTDAEIEQLSKVQTSKRPDRAMAPPRELAARAVAFALEHCLERRSAVRERTLLAEALRWGVGWVDVRHVFEVFRELEARGGVLVREGYVTTTAVLREEQTMLTLARNGKGQCPRLASGAVLSADLSPQQQKAASHVLESTDRVILVRGAAGTGKTFLLSQVAKHIPNLTVLAPSAEASRGVLRSEGFESAETVARYLVDEQLQAASRGGVVWVDEAGLLGTRVLVRLLEVTQSLGCRVVLMGDRRQNPSVERGSTLRQLELEAGLTPAAVTEIRRQRGEYRDAVYAISRGRFADGFRQLDGLGWIYESRAHLRDAAIEYAAQVRDGKRVLAVCPTHVEGEELTRLIRQALGVSHSRSLLRLEAKQLTQAEKRSAQSYEVGDVVENRRTGKRSRVVEVTDSAVWTDSGKRLYLNGTAGLEVYRMSDLTIAPGEAIRVTKNAKSLCGKHRLNNGSIYVIRAIDDKVITLENGWRLPRDFGHMSHAYVSTAVAAQGRTTDVVIVVQGVASLGAASPEAWYVSVSRGRECAKVFTDSKATLLRSISQESDRPTAADVMTSERWAYLRARERGEKLCDTQKACQAKSISSPKDIELLA